MTTAIVHPYPTDADRNRIHDFIQLYAKGQMNLNSLFYCIGGIIEKYPHLSRIPVQGYSVRILQYYGAQRLPIISISGAEFSQSCPCCGSGSEDNAKYLRTDQENFDKNFDIVSATCLDCGCVYLTEGWNGRVGRRKEGDV